MGSDPLYVASVAETVRLSVEETEDPRESRRYLLELRDALYDADLEGDLYEELLSALEGHADRLQDDNDLGAVGAERRQRIADDVYRVERYCQRNLPGDAGDTTREFDTDVPRTPDADGAESPDPGATETDPTETGPTDTGSTDAGSAAGLGVETGVDDGRKEHSGADGDQTIGGSSRSSGGGSGPTGDEFEAISTGAREPGVDSAHLFSTVGSVRGGPFLVDGTLYVGCQEGIVYAVDPGTGTERWRYRDDERIASQVAVGESAVYLGSRARVTAIDRATGSERWAAGSLATTGTPTVARGPDRVFAATADLRALDPDTGEVTWKLGLGSNAWALATDTRNVYAGTNDGLVRAVGTTFGSERWSVLVGGTVRRVVAYSGTVYARNNEGDLYAIDRGSGDIEWRCHGDGSGSGAGPLVGAGEVAVCLGGSFYSLGPEDGDTWWRFDGDDAFGLSASAMASDGTTYVGDHQGTVHAFDGWGCEREWRTSLADGDQVKGLAAGGGTPIAAVGRDLHRLSPGGSG